MKFAVLTKLWLENKEKARQYIFRGDNESIGDLQLQHKNIFRVIGFITIPSIINIVCPF